jgi:hemolysin activation/secretion protein
MGRIGGSRWGRLFNWGFILALFLWLAGSIAFAEQNEAPASAPPKAVNEDEEILTFEIAAYDIVGNTILSPANIARTLKPYTGSNKTVADVEKARDTLERFYHDQGYPTVLVNIPEQTVEGGSVQLEVIESKIRRVRITGNRYFTMRSIRKKLPSFRRGELLYLPKIQEELAQINRSPDLKVAPVLMPGKELGTIDVELKVKDNLPLHGSLELNNRNTHDTTDLRLNTQISYDNLWQKEHSISFQFQTSPEDTDEVQAIAGSYVLPSPWNANHVLALYGLVTDSETAFGQGFTTVGKGQIFGLRYVMSLPALGEYAHNLSVGVDYKDFDEQSQIIEELETPITYLPLSFAYNSSLRHHAGLTQFSGGLNMVFRGLVTDREEFEDKRFKSRGNYIFMTLGIERYQELPYGFQLFLKGDGQIADQPLPSNEQYFAGGLRNVRGYKEVEAAGDDAIHATAELAYPELGKLLGLPAWCGLSPNIFIDYADLHIKDALPGEDQPDTLAGTGAGIKGYITRFFEYELAWGHALKDTARTEAGDNLIYFVTKGQF